MTFDLTGSKARVPSLNDEIADRIRVLVHEDKSNEVRRVFRRYGIQKLMEADPRDYEAILHDLNTLCRWPECGRLVPCDDISAERMAGELIVRRRIL